MKRGLLQAVVANLPQVVEATVYDHNIAGCCRHSIIAGVEAVVVAMLHRPLQQYSQRGRRRDSAWQQGCLITHSISNSRCRFNPPPPLTHYRFIVHEPRLTGGCGWGSELVPVMLPSRRR